MLRAALLVILVQAPSTAPYNGVRAQLQSASTSKLSTILRHLNYEQTNKPTANSYPNSLLKPAEINLLSVPRRYFWLIIQPPPSSVASLHGAPVWRRRGKVSAECFRVRASKSKNMARYQLNVG